MTTYIQLRDRMEQHLSKAQVISRKAEDAGRDFTPAEFAEVQEHLDQAKLLAPELKILKADERVKQQLRGLGPDVPGYQPSSSGHSGGGYATGASRWAQTVAGRLAKTAATHGVKSISTGGISIPAVIEPTVVLPDRPARLLDLVPVRGLTSNEFSYPKQTARTPNPATVADGALKPTSVYTFEQVVDRSRVVAHLSEPIPLHYFDDHSDLESILDDQMRVDLMLKVEGLVATGSGAGEDWTGILATSGVLNQPWTSDLVTTLRKARTLLEVLGEQPTAFAFNPLDVETLDLLHDTQSRYYGQELNSLLGNLPRIASSSITVGTAVLGDFRQSRLFVRQEATLDVDRSGDLFRRNEVQLRCEMRAGYGVLRPQAFVAVDLTA